MEEKCTECYENKASHGGFYVSLKRKEYYHEYQENYRQMNCRSPFPFSENIRM